MLRISIITPSFNQGEYLEECLDSVLSQNYPNLEYIVMDGGSTDGSQEIIRKYQKHLLYWRSHPDGGQYHAVNEGFLRTSGEIMAWLNSDDKYHPGALWLVADAFRSFPEVEWLMGSPTLWDSAGRSSGFSATPPVMSCEKYLRGEFHRPYVQQESTFWRRPLWERAGSGLDTSFPLAADMELWARFFRYARLYTLHAPLGGFRSHAGQRSALFLDQYHREAERVVARERRIFQASGAGPLSPPHPIEIHDVVRRARSRILPETFGFFAYSRTLHFPYFDSSAIDLYGKGIDLSSADLKDYQELLVYTFIRHNVPRGGRILEIGGAGSRAIRAMGSDYDCWRVDDSGGTGNDQGAGPEGVTLVRDGIDSPGLPAGHFDLVFSISSLEQVPKSEENCRNLCRDIARVLKPGGWSLYCFDVAAGSAGISCHGLLRYLLKTFPALCKWAPLEQIYLDPYVHCLDETSYNRYRRGATGIPYAEHGIPLSYNVLWQNQPRPAEGSRQPEIVLPLQKAWNGAAA